MRSLIFVLLAIPTTNTPRQVKYRSIRSVLAIGHLSITIPVLLTALLMIYFLFKDVQGWFSFVEALLAYAATIVIAWCWWSYAIIKWQVWSFEQLAEEDWIEFYRKSVVDGNILADAPRYAIARTRSEEDLQRLRLIEERILELEEVELIQMELALPQAIAYKIAATEIIPVMLIGTVLGWLLVDSVMEGHYFLGAMLVVSLTFVLLELRYLPLFFRGDPILVLCKTYVQLGYEKVYWEDINRIRLTKAGPTLFLFVKTVGGEQVKELRLSNVDIGHFESFWKQLQVFKDRYALDL